MSTSRKVVVIGGAGLVGSRVVSILRQSGHEAVVASSGNGIDAFTGEGLEAAFAGADAVIDVLNMMSYDGPVIRNFFGTTSRNLMAAGKVAGVRHHVALSIVGTDGLAANPYLSGKQAQEEAVRASGQDYTIVRATQFYEFMDNLAGAFTVDDAIIVPDTQFQPVAADDVAATLVSVALGSPHNGVVDLAGPDRGRFKSVMKAFLEARGDARDVKSDPALGYFGAAVNETSLVPLGDSLRGRITFAQYLHDQARAKQEEAVASG